MLYFFIIHSFIGQTVLFKFYKDFKILHRSFRFYEWFSVMISLSMWLLTENQFFFIILTEFLDFNPPNY